MCLFDKKNTNIMRYELKQFKTTNLKKEQDLQTNIGNVTVSCLKQIQKQEEEIFTTVLRTIAEPPIKGEITKGKLTWRGIRLIKKQVGFDSYSWLEQRGKQIGPKFYIEAKLFK